MSLSDFSNELHRTAKTIGLEALANILTKNKKQNPKIEDDAITKWFMYSPLVDLHDTSIQLSTTPNILKTRNNDHLGTFGMRKYVPTTVNSYQLIHTTVGGGLTFPTTNRKFSGSVVFDGSNLIKIDDHTILKPTDKITILGWFYLIKNSTTQHVVKMQETSTPYNLRITNTNMLKFRIRTDNAGGTTYNKDIAAANWTDNQWNHIVATWSGASDNRLRIYLNKVKEGSDVVTAGALQYSGIPGLGIGGGPVGGSNKVINGTKMSWLSLLHAELTQAQIDAHFDGILDTAAYEEITTIPFIAKEGPMPDAFSGMFIS